MNEPRMIRQWGDGEGKDRGAPPNMLLLFYDALHPRTKGLDGLTPTERGNRLWGYLQEDMERIKAGKR